MKKSVLLHTVSICGQCNKCIRDDSVEMASFVYQVRDETATSIVHSQKQRPTRKSIDTAKIAKHNYYFAMQVVSSDFVIHLFFA